MKYPALFTSEDIRLAEHCFKISVQESVMGEIKQKLEKTYGCNFTGVLTTCLPWLFEFLSRKYPNLYFFIVKSTAGYYIPQIYDNNSSEFKIKYSGCWESATAAYLSVVVELIDIEQNV